MSIKVIHYINQFFAGKGGEEETDHPLERIDGPVGPGQMLQRELNGGNILLTLFCGDGYFGTHEDEVLKEIRSIIQRISPDVIITGPAFGSGRYGLACGAVAACAMSDCGVPAIAGMSHDNPAVQIYRSQAYVVPTGESVRGMADALQRMAQRQKGEMHFPLLDGAADDFDRRLDVVEDVQMRQHHSLGIAGCAGSVDQRGQVLP